MAKEIKKIVFKLQPFQEEFVYSEAKFPAMVSAVGTGKTLCGILRMALRLQQHADNLGLVVRKNFVDLRDSTVRDWTKYTGLKVDSNGNSRFSNGSVVMFRHGEQLDTLKNINLGVCMMEQAEEFDDDAQFQFLKHRMRRAECGEQSLYIIANTNGNNWIKQLWKTNPRTMIPRITYSRGKGIEESKYPVWGYHLVEATSWDNAPNLTESFLTTINEQKVSCPQLYQRMVMNSWDITSGKIYAEWSKDYHIIPKGVTPKDWTCFGTMDTAIASGVFCALIIKITPEGHCVVVDEYYDKEKIISQHCNEIKQMMTEGDHEPAYWILDPSAFNRTRERAKPGKLYSVANELEDYGIYGMEGENSVNAGINRVAEYLKIDYSKKHPFKQLMGSPKLFVMEHCTNTIREMANYREVPNKVSERGDRKWMPYKRDDHAPDALRYGIMSRPSSPSLHEEYIPPRFSVARIESDIRREKEAAENWSESFWS